MSKFYAGFGLGLFMLLAMVLYQRSNCPCGFKYDAFSGGCQVDSMPAPAPARAVEPHRLPAGPAALAVTRLAHHLLHSTRRGVARES